MRCTCACVTLMAMLRHQSEFRGLCHMRCTCACVTVMAMLRHLSEFRGLCHSRCTCACVTLMAMLRFPNEFRGLCHARCTCACVMLCHPSEFRGLCHAKCTCACITLIAMLRHPSELGAYVMQGVLVRASREAKSMWLRHTDGYAASPKLFSLNFRAYVRRGVLVLVSHWWQCCVTWVILDYWHARCTCVCVAVMAMPRNSSQRWLKIMISVVH